MNVLSDKFSTKWKKRLEGVWLVLALSILPLFMWQTYIDASKSLRTGEMALDISLPMYPGKFAISAGFLLWTIQIIIFIIEKIRGTKQAVQGGTK